MDANEALYLISSAAEEHGLGSEGWPTAFGDLEEALGHALEELDADARVRVLHRLSFLEEAAPLAPDSFRVGTRVWWMNLSGDVPDRSGPATVIAAEAGREGAGARLALVTDRGDRVALGADHGEVLALSPGVEDG